VFTTAVGIDAIADLAEIAQIELVVIDERTRVGDLRKELRWNEAYYR
jgi:L-arabinose isomerase